MGSPLLRTLGMDPNRRTLHTRMQRGLAIVGELPEIITSVILIDNTEAYKLFRDQVCHVLC